MRALARGRKREKEAEFEIAWSRILTAALHYLPANTPRKVVVLGARNSQWQVRRTDRQTVKGDNKLRGASERVLARVAQGRKERREEKKSQ